MTYLELVNAVLRRLRESEASTVAESDYSQLIGDFVNDAKRLVEEAWNWSSLRTTQNVTTVSGTNEYALEDFGVRSEVFQVFNETAQYELRKMPLEQIRKNTLAGNADGDPYNYALSGVDANGDIKIRVYPTPNATATLSVYGVKRTADLSADADTTSVPSQLIVQWAYSYALIERGETGGGTGAEQALFANKAMQDAIALDAGMHSDELIWTTV